MNAGSQITGGATGINASTTGTGQVNITIANGATVDGTTFGINAFGLGTILALGTVTSAGTAAQFNGTFQIGNGGTAGAVNGNIVNNGTLIADRSDTFTLAGVISGSGDFHQDGTGTTTLSAVNLYTGATAINDGTLLVTGSILGSATTVHNGGTLGGTGTTGAVNVANGGTLSPGASAGTLATGNLSFTAGANFTVELGGTGAGQWDRVNVTGSVNLANATLNASLISAFDPEAATGAAFTIIDNDLSDAVGGIFSGLAEGATVIIGGSRFSITYAGGTNSNDVVLTALNDAPVITSDGGGAAAVLSSLENRTAVTTVKATDPDGPSLTFSLFGGADAARFKINAATGALAFKVAPDFEAPTDVGHNNSYVVRVRASDGSLRTCRRSR